METEIREVFDWDNYRSDLWVLCESKAEELHLLGYEEVQAEDVWACVRQLQKNRGPLHEVVSAILSLNAGKFMSYLTMSAFKGTL